MTSCSSLTASAPETRNASRRTPATPIGGSRPVRRPADQAARNKRRRVRSGNREMPSRVAACDVMIVLWRSKVRSRLTLLNRPGEISSGRESPNHANRHRRIPPGRVAAAERLRAGRARGLANRSRLAGGGGLAVVSTTPIAAARDGAERCEIKLLHYGLHGYFVRLTTSRARGYRPGSVFQLFHRKDQCSNYTAVGLILIPEMPTLGIIH